MQKEQRAAYIAQQEFTAALMAVQKEMQSDPVAEYGGSKPPNKAARVCPAGRRIAQS